MSSSLEKKSDNDSGSIEKGVHEIDLPVLANQHALDVSLTLPGMAGVHDDNEIDPAESARVKRKLDLHLLPLLFLLYTRMFSPYFY
jgi:ACS family allantoate permease-like MFS transporter